MTPGAQLDLFKDLSAFEGTDVEYKAAKGGLPASMWETYSAFANTDGGDIYFGITERNGVLDVHGVDDPERMQSDLWNTVNNKSKVNRNLLKNSDVEVLAIVGSDRKVIAIHVPRAGRHDRPVFVGTDPFSGTYRRNYESDYRCSDVEVRRMFSDQSDEPADSRIMRGFSMDDLDVDSLRQFRNRFLSRAPGHPWLAKDDQGLLEQLGGWRRDRTDAIEGITLAGLLMFGKTEAIQATEAVPGYQVDYRERFSEDPATRWTDRLTIDGTWEANLFQFYQKVYARFAADSGLKRPFSQDAQGVRPLVTPVHDALQEALVNALIHADYNGQGGIVIDRYLDRFEFSNPGTLLVSMEQILRGSVSECRNKSLQRMFQMLGVGDKAGSGIDKIRTSWAAQHWQSPRLEETQRPDRVKLSLPMVSMLPEEVLTALQKRFGACFRTLGKEPVQSLVTAAVEKSVSNQRLQEILTLHRRDITLLLQRLVREHYLVPDGFGRWTSYTLGAGPERHSSGVTVSNPSSPVSGVISPVSGASSPDSGSSLPDSVPNSHDPDELLRLRELARPVSQAGSAPREVVRATILNLCEGRFLGLRELSSLLDRRTEALRDSYVSPMVREGLLELRYPNKPTHQNQAYRTNAAVKEGAAK